MDDFCPFFLASVVRRPDLGNSERRSLRGCPRHSGPFRTPDRQV